MMGMGDPDDDSFFGPIRHMDMINSMFNDPFGMMGGHRSAIQGPQRGRPNQVNQVMPFGGMLGGGLFGGGMFGFPNMNHLFDNMSAMSTGMSPMAADPHCHSFSSSTVMTMTSGPDGRPQVYQASSSTRSAPGGIKETKKTVCDSRSGVKKMAIGHHIGERAHIVEREKNLYTGDEEHRENLVNLDEEEAPQFTREWHEKTGTVGVGAVTYDRSNGRRYTDQLALPSTSPVSPSTTRVEITEVTDDDDDNANTNTNSPSSSPIIEYPSASASHSRRENRDRERYHPTSRTHIQEHQKQEGSRKRDHEDDYEERRRHHKSRKPY